MRFAGFAILVVAALMLAAGPAQAQWKGYVSRDYGFSFHAPGTMAVEKGTYKADRSGEQPTVVFRSAADNIEYRVIVSDFRQRAGDGANLLLEAAYAFQNGRNALMDTYARVDDVFGRKITVDLPNNGGRSMAAFFFSKGYLIQFQGTVLPANGDYGSPDVSRFIDSHSFAETRLNPGVTELKAPN